MDPTTAKRLGLGVMSFAPGMGAADAAGLYPNAEGGHNPSLRENWRQGNYGTALLQGLGALGDAAYVAPVVGAGLGAAMKAPRAIQRGLTMGEDLARSLHLPHVGGGTFEYMPGKSVMNTGHVPEAQAWNDARKVQYGNAGGWTKADGTDSLYGAAGYSPGRTQSATGSYLNSEKALEQNPANVTSQAVHFDPNGALSARDASNMHAIENYRGVVDGQEAYAFNAPFVGGANPDGYLFPGRQLPKDMMGKAASAADPFGYGVTASPNGTLAFPMGADPVAEVGSAVGDRIGVKGVPVTSNTGYGPAVGKWKGYDIVPSAPYSGEATTQVLDAFKNAEPGLAERIASDPVVQSQIGVKVARDAGVSARGDLQNTRNFFAGADFPAVVRLMQEKGLPAAAALAALGYSTSSFAGESNGGTGNP